MSYVEERSRHEANWAETISKSRRKYEEPEESGELPDASIIHNAEVSVTVKWTAVSNYAHLSPTEFVLAHAATHPKLAIGLVAPRYPEIFAELRRGSEVHVMPRTAPTIQFECRSGTYETRVDTLVVHIGVGECFVVLASLPELIVGRGPSESDAMEAALWQLEERLDTAFLRAKFGKPAPADAPEVVRWNRWREEHAKFVGKSNVVFRSFFGQLAARDDSSVMLRWTNADEDDAINVAGIPGSHLLSLVPVGEWFSSRVIQRIDTFELTAILDVVPGRPPLDEALADEEREALRKKFIDLESEDC